MATLEELRRRAGVEQQAPSLEALRARAGAAEPQQEQAPGSGGLAFLNRGISMFLGLPVDTANAALGLVGLGSEAPMGGRVRVEAGLRKLGVGVPRPDEEAETMGQRVAQEVGVGAAALPLAPAMATIRGAGALATAARQVGQTAIKHPAATAAAEMGAAAGAGAGASYAAEAFPDNPDAAAAYGALAGGFGIPLLATASTRYVLKTGVGARFVRGQFAGATKAGARTQAEDRLQQMAVDPEATAARFDDPDIIPDVLTPAQRTGNRRILALERAIMETNPELEQRLLTKLDEGHKQLRAELSTLGRNTTPEATREFMATRRDHVLSLVGDRARIAAATAQERVAQLAPEDPAHLRETSNRVLREEIDRALADSMATERQLWDAVPLDQKVRPETTKQAVADIIADQGAFKEISDLPVFVRRLITRKVTVRADGTRSKGKLEPRLREEHTAKDLQQLRSDVLEEMREAKSKGKRMNARYLNQLQEALLEDMATMGGDDAYRTALDFSRTLNDKFRRGPVGRMLGFRRSGEGSLPPELTLEATVGRGGPEGGVNADALLKALDDAPGAARLQIEDFLRSGFAQQALKPDGTLDVAAAERFMRRNAPVLDRFPGLRSQLQDAGQAQAAAKRAAERFGSLEKSLHNRKLSRASLWLDAPVDQEISALLRDRNPRVATQELVRMARRDPSGRALEGLKTAFSEHLLKKASTNQFTESGTNMVSGRALRDMLSDPPTSRVAQALLEPAEWQRLRRIAVTLERLEIASGRTPNVGGVVDPAKTTILEFTFRTMGARLGAQFGKGTSGASLLTAGFLSKRFKKMHDFLMERLARGGTRKLLTAAVEDGELFRALLTSPNTLKREQFIERRLNAWLLAEFGEQIDADDTATE